MEQDITLAQVDMSFGAVLDAEGNDVVPAVVLTVVAVGEDVAKLSEQPVEMLGILMEQIAARHSEGLINPVKTFDSREQADGSPE